MRETSPFRRCYGAFQLLVIALCILLPCAAEAAETPNRSRGDVTTGVIAEAKTSILPVACFTGPMNQQTVSAVVGTAAFINRDGDIITNEHVARLVSATSTIPRGNCTYMAYVPVEGWSRARATFNTQTFRVGACDSDAAHDIAVCHLAPNPFADGIVRDHIKPAIFHPQPVDDGTPIAFSGFPLNNVRPITSKGDVAASHAAVGALPDAPALSELIIIDRASWHGASGSIVYTADEWVIGMITRTGINEGQGLCYAITAMDIAQFLTSHAIAFFQR